MLREGEMRTIVFYEAPHRILETLADVELTWGAAVRVVVARELTKRHEEFLRGTAAEVRTQLAARDRIRGEIALLVEARRPVESKSGALSVAERVEELVKAEGLEAKDALKRVARERGLSKSEAYRELQQAKKNGIRGKGPGVGS
jgi:16S rRNA (cytidine1402-2'-O)-methyltransferase